MSWCRKQARKDAADGEKAADKARERISRTIEGSVRRARFVKVDTEGVSINEEAILRDENSTVCTECGPVLITTGVAPSVYASITGNCGEHEESFRVMKHSMSASPAFHWTERRVRAHAAVRCAASSLPCMCKWRFNPSHPGQLPLSERRIFSELRDARASPLIDENNGMRYLVALKSGWVRRFLCSAVGVKLCRETVLLSRLTGM